MIAQRCVKHRLESGSAGRRGDLLDRLVDDMRTKQAGGRDDGEVSEADVVTDAMLLLWVAAHHFFLCFDTRI